jgi:hypothetical protein
MERVIVQRTYEVPMSEDDVRAAAREGGCSDLHRVFLRKSYLSPDGLTMICVYEAPDAETVRALQRSGGLPYDRIWTCSVHGAETP